jgi:hypothetical protein
VPAAIKKFVNHINRASELPLLIFTCLWFGGCASAPSAQATPSSTPGCISLTYNQVLAQGIFSPDRRLVAMASSHYLGGNLQIWDVSSGQLIHEFKSIYGITGFALDSSQLEVSVCTLPETICGATGIQRLSIYH